MLQRLLLTAVLLLGTASGAFSQAPNLSTTSASTTIANLRSDDEKIRQEAARNLFYVCDAAPDLTAVVNGIGPLLLSPDAHVKLAVLACFEKMDLLRPEQGPAIAKFKAALMKGTEDHLRTSVNILSLSLVQQRGFLTRIRKGQCYRGSPIRVTKCVASR